MAYWKNEEEREDGDTHDETRDAAADARKWLRSEASKSQSDFIRGITGDLASLENAAGPFFLGVDYDNDYDDVDDMGPF